MFYRFGFLLLGFVLGFVLFLFLGRFNDDEVILDRDIVIEYRDRVDSVMVYVDLSRDKVDSLDLVIDSLFELGENYSAVTSYERILEQEVLVLCEKVYEQDRVILGLDSVIVLCNGLVDGLRLEVFEADRGLRESVIARDVLDMKLGRVKRQRNVLGLGFLGLTVLHVLR